MYWRIWLDFRANTKDARPRKKLKRKPEDVLLVMIGHGDKFAFLSPEVEDRQIEIRDSSNLKDRLSFNR
jgi:hypothetical protein